MPHKCVKCGQLFDDGSAVILQGCSSCGSKFFFYVRKQNLEKAEEIIENLSNVEKEQIESDVKDIIGPNFDEERPVVLDIETVRILKPGKYEIDLVGAFSGRPLVYRLEEGKYFIDLDSAIKKKISVTGKN
ncbi:hypothetical protein J4468_02085 [Candidatus Woesearchaeota archaeon]|nr:hypothetical protein [Candidatus Woesearchaeota archaeon]